MQAVVVCVPASLTSEMTNFTKHWTRQFKEYMEYMEYVFYKIDGPEMETLFVYSGKVANSNTYDQAVNKIGVILREAVCSLSGEEAKIIWPAVKKKQRKLNIGQQNEIGGSRTWSVRGKPITWKDP